MKKLMCASLFMSLMLFTNAYSQNSNSNNNNSNKYSYWQNANQVAQNNVSEPTTIYPTERGSSSGITAAAKEDRLYQSRGYPINPSQVQNTTPQPQSQTNQNMYNADQNYQRNPYQSQGMGGQNNQVYYDQNTQSQEPQQFNSNDQQNYGYRYR